MTITLRKYEQAIGKLYTIPRIHPLSPPEDAALVMPYKIAKFGGWYFFICNVLTNREKVYDPDATRWSCADFLRKATIISGQPPEVK